MDTTDRSDKLVIVKVNWEQKPGNAWLLREIYDLLLLDPDEAHAGRGPDLTDGDMPLTMEPQAIPDEEGGER